MELNLYKTTINLKDYDVYLANHTDNESDRIYFSGIGESKIFFSYSMKKKEIVIYEDEKFKKATNIIQAKDYDVVCDILNCLCFDEAEDPSVEVVEPEEQEQQVNQLENEENLPALTNDKESDK